MQQACCLVRVLRTGLSAKRQLVVWCPFMDQSRIEYFYYWWSSWLCCRLPFGTLEVGMLVCFNVGWRDPWSLSHLRRLEVLGDLLELTCFRAEILFGSHLGYRPQHKFRFSPASQSISVLYHAYYGHVLTSFSKNYDLVCISCHSFAPFNCLVDFGLKDVLWNFQPKRHAVESVSTERGIEGGEITRLLVENNVPVPALGINNGYNFSSG